MWLKALRTALCLAATPAVAIISTSLARKSVSLHASKRIGPAFAASTARESSLLPTLLAAPRSSATRASARLRPALHSFGTRRACDCASSSRPCLRWCRVTATWPSPAQAPPRAISAIRSTATCPATSSRQPSSHDRERLRYSADVPTGNRRARLAPSRCTSSSGTARATAMRSSSPVTKHNSGCESDWTWTMASLTSPRSTARTARWK